MDGEDDGWSTFVTKGTLRRFEQAQRRARQDDLFLRRRQEAQSDSPLVIQWQHPDKIGKMSDGYTERTSKALDPESELAKALECARARIVAYCKNGGFTIKKMWPLQVELLTRHDEGNLATLQRRALLMSGLSVDLSKLVLRGSSLVLQLEPAVIEKYRGLHITLCTFDTNTIPSEIEGDLYDLVNPEKRKGINP